MFPLLARSLGGRKKEKKKIKNDYLENRNEGCEM